MSLRSALRTQRPNGVRALDAVIGTLSGLRSRVAGPTSVQRDDGSPVVYGEMWRPQDEEHARQLIFNDPDPDTFERSGQADAERLAPLISSSDVVLDLGCGIGRVARYVAPLCATIWAVDASETMLSHARSRLGALSNVRYARCEGTRIPEIASASVDVAYSLLVLQHLEREDAFALLRDVHRVLRTDGRAYLTFPNLLSDPYLDCFLTYVEGGEVTNPVRARLYTPQEVERILPAAGFAVESIEPGVEIVACCRALPAVS